VPESIPLVILDPDAEFRGRLRAWLEGIEDIAVVGETQDREEAQKLMASRRIRILVADLDALGGAEGVAYLATRFPETRMLVLHRGEEQAGVVEALQRGAWGHLAKETLRPEEVVEAIRTVARGGAYLSPTLTGWMVEAVARRLRERRGGRK